MKKNILLNIILILLFLLISCDEDNNVKNNQKNEQNTVINNTGNKITKKNIVYAPFINEKAKFIAGFDTDLYSDIQDKKSYKKYQSEVEKYWNLFFAKNILPVQKWVESENITNESDSVTLFYPFSGPDFLYANTFFPYCKNYILFGLEKPGTIPDFNSLADSSINQYFNDLKYSLRQINAMGFFVTQQMKYDFRKSHFNGVVHLLLFYLAKTKHQIIDFTPFYIDYNGNIVPKEKIQELDKRIQGIMFKFREKNSTKIKTLYYIQVDASNGNLINKLELTHFISNFQKKISFIKSGSYLLHVDIFSIIRDIVVEQSDKILQDDTGLPFKYFATNNFEVRLFGNYSRTINIYSEKFQPALEKALRNEKQDKNIPFKFGYNKQFGETILIFATKTSTTVQNDANNDTVIYKVQLQISWDKIDFNDEIFNGLPQVDYYHNEGYYKYTVGRKFSEEACRDLLDLAHELGFEDAFIAAFYQGNRISLDEAKELNSL